LDAAQYAQIAVLAQLGRAGGLYTYGVPTDLAGTIRPGHLVEVPFGKRRLPGVICSLTDATDLPRVRAIVTLLDPDPVVTEHGLSLARWIADYYATPQSDVIGAMLPPGVGRKPVTYLEPGDESDGKRITSAQRTLLELVEERGRLRLDAVAEAVDDPAVRRAVASLVRRGLLRRIVELPAPRLGPRLIRVATATEAGREALAGGTVRGPRQRDVLAILVKGPLTVPDLEHRVSGARTALNALTRNGLVSVEESPATEEKPTEEGTRPLDLSAAQSRALCEILRSVRDRRYHTFLLHGVTGSGKTEVYLQAIAETIAGGRQAIMMVPEISLTPQALQRVSDRFPGRVAVLHSQLTGRGRTDTWQRIRRGQVDVVVGPRSALFAPLPHPGLIVVDEEHDASYKQDSSPRYNARDAAAVFGRITGTTVIFGSATPDIGTYEAAREGRITLLELPDRPVWGESGRRPMPAVEIVDMRQELKDGNRSMFSSRLAESLQQTLASDHQALLFLNRRGNATVVICRDCGYVVTCPHCDIPLTYHSAGTQLICHRCDFRRGSPRVCPVCESQRIRYLGAGTQRVEEEVKRQFPQARVLRWDRDVTGTRDAHERILQRFARREADVLVGTQMIAKGLDFPAVTLVGVISADAGLHLPDFRAPERSFQLLTQVAGRAGRSTLPSTVIVQTYTPEHYAVQAARDHDYHTFFAAEMRFRRDTAYPPAARLIRLVYSSPSEEDCRRAGIELRAALVAVGEDDATTDVIGPAPCFAARVRGKHYWQIILRAPTLAALRPLLDYVPAGWSIDVDPIDLL